jgi:hypothetical protein
MKPEFIIMNQKTNSRACNGSTHDLLVEGVLGIPTA